MEGGEPLAKNSKSNREKIFSNRGDVFFGKVYNFTTVPSDVKAVHIFLTKFLVSVPIRKSPDARNNRNMICKKGKVLYVLGKVEGPADKEYLVFSTETWVFKRKWLEIIDFVTPMGSDVWDMDVVSTGEVRCKVASHTKKGTSIETTMAFKVQFTNDPMSAVWFTTSGVWYMMGLSTPAEAESRPHPNGVYTCPICKKSVQNEQCTLCMGSVPQLAPCSVIDDHNDIDEYAKTQCPPPPQSTLTSQQMLDENESNNLVYRHDDEYSLIAPGSKKDEQTSKPSDLFIDDLFDDPFFQPDPDEWTFPYV